MHNVLPAAADAGFYELVHELLEAERIRQVKAAPTASRDANHRQSARRSFRCVQLLAPFHDGRLPSQSEFLPVVCRDLSGGGFSFYSESRIEFRQVIVALGQVPFQFFTAAVINQTRSRTRQGPTFRVGCRFSGRIE